MDIRVVLLVAIFALAMAIKPAIAEAHRSSSGSGGGGGGGSGGGFFSGGGGGGGHESHSLGSSGSHESPVVHAPSNPTVPHVEPPSLLPKIESKPPLPHETLPSPNRSPSAEPSRGLPISRDGGPAAHESEARIRPVSFHPIKPERLDREDDAYWHRHHRSHWHQPIYFENGYAEESFWDCFFEQLMLAMMSPDPAMSAAMVPPPDTACDIDGDDCVPIGWYQGEYNSPEFYFNPDPGESLYAYRDRVGAALANAKARLNDSRACSDSVEEATLEDAITTLNERIYKVEDRLGLATTQAPALSGPTHY